VQTPFSYPLPNKEMNPGSCYPPPVEIKKKKKKIERTKRKKKEKRKEKKEGISLRRRDHICKYIWHIHCSFDPPDPNILLTFSPKGKPAPKKAKSLKGREAKLWA